MKNILIGGGSGQSVWRVKEIPNVGDTITVTKSMVVRTATDAGYFVIGSTYRFTERMEDRKVNGNILPWFAVELVQ